jgi:hypothetical protein
VHTRRDPVYNRWCMYSRDRNRRTCSSRSCEYCMIIAHISKRCKYDTWCLVEIVVCIYDARRVLWRFMNVSSRFCEDLVGFLWGGTWQIALLMLRSLYSQEPKGFITRTRDLYETLNTSFMRH